MSTPATRGGDISLNPNVAQTGSTSTLNPRPAPDPRTMQTTGESYNQLQQRRAALAQQRREATIAAGAGLPGGGQAPGAGGTGGASGVLNYSVNPNTPNMEWSNDAYINIAKPGNYVLGGDPRYVGRASQAAQDIAQQGAAQQQAVGGTQMGLAGRSAVTGAQYADRLNNAGLTMGAYGQAFANQINEQARATTGMGDLAFAQGNAAANRAGPVADFGQQNAALGQSQGAADQLMALESQQGPSGAQAQLQAGLNAAADSNTSLARSGRGWGQSASALAQAGRNNATMGANVANQADMLRAQEDAAARQRAAANIATGAGIQQAAAQQFGQQAQADVQNALQTTQLNDAARAQLYSNALQAQQVAGSQQTAAGQLGLSGLQAGAAATGQAGQMDLVGQAQASQMANLAGQNYALGTQQQQQALTFGSQLAQTQLQASQAYEQARLQEYGIRKGVALQNNNQTMQLIGAGLAAAGAAAGAVSDERAKERIVPVSATDALIGGDDPFYGSSPGPNRGDAMEADAAALGRARTTQGSAYGGYAGPDRDQMAQHMRAAADSMQDSERRRRALAAFGGGMRAFGGMLGGGGDRGLAMVDAYTPGGIYTSDEREKTDLRSARGYSYEYKDPERHGEGRFYGPMAQDLLKTPAGRSSVVQQPDGTLGVDTGRLALATVPAVAEQQQRQDDLNERLYRLESLLFGGPDRRTAEGPRRDPLAMRRASTQEADWG